MSLIATLFPDRLIPYLETIKAEFEKHTDPVISEDTQRCYDREQTTRDVLKQVSRGVDIPHDIGLLIGKQPNTVRTHLKILMARGLIVRVDGIPSGVTKRRTKDRFYLKHEEAA